MTASKLDDATRTILLACAERGLPVRIAAPIARIKRQTLHNWLKRDDEPYASFAADYREKLANAGASLIDKVADDVNGAKWLLSVVHKIKEPEPKQQAQPQAMAILALARDTKRLPTETVHARLSATQVIEHDDDSRH